MRHSLWLACASALLVTACQRDTAPSTSPEAPAAKVEAKSAAAAPELDTKTLLLPQAQFVWDTDASGKRRPKPGPAKLVLLRPNGATFRTSVLEDPESRVFHKALCVAGDAGTELLTIGGTDALLKLWRPSPSGWQAETLWHPTFGGEWDRLRDMEIGDLDGNGQDEVVIGTHDQGVIAIVSRTETSWAVREIYREPSTFVHEIELGDLDGDGKLEIYATPSKPNKADKSQPGRILALLPQADGSYRPEVVADLKDSHAKEILVADIDGDGKPELYGAIEATRHGGPGTNAPVEVRRFERTKKGKWSSTLVAALPGAVQSRVLLAADLQGTGRKSIVVTTMKGGIWQLTPVDKRGAFAKELIDAESSGFEHAAGVADLDGDGKPELYVAADDQDAVRQYQWNGQNFDRKDIATLEPSDLTWSIEACRPKKL